MKLSIIVPVYNEENTLEEILKRVEKLDTKEIVKEIVVVNDGSSDRTPAILSKIGVKNKNIKILNHKRNVGKGAAVITGIKNATGDILIIQDADLEYDPNDIPRIIKPIIDKKNRVVYGTRLKMKPVLFGKNRTPLLLHFFGNKFLSLITTVIYGSNVSDMETCYKAFDSQVLKGIKLKSKSFDFEPEVTAKILKRGIKIKEVEIKTNPRGYDEGKKLHTFRDGFKALWTLLKYRVSD